MRRSFGIIGIAFTLLEAGCTHRGNYVTDHNAVDTKKYDTLEHRVIPPNGVVPSTETAIKIAEAVLIPIYGYDQIKRQSPLRAQLHKDIWIVEGTVLRGNVGGAARIEIAKEDGRIFRITHGR